MRRPPPLFALALGIAALTVAACEPKPKPKPKDVDGDKAPAAAEAAPPSPSEAGDPDDLDPKDEAKQATFADPKLEAPPAPAGAVALEDPWLYVQTCSADHPCVDLKQPAGDAHCRELRLGDYGAWRLPSKAEVERLSGVEGLENLAGYHWTRTPFEDDINQVWIVDPADPVNAPATTIARDRKPFRIRCVKEP